MDLAKDKARELEEFDEDASVSRRRMLDGELGETFHAFVVNKTCFVLFNSTFTKIVKD